MNDKPHYAGHRSRLRQRFMKSGGDAIADYEMLELVLFLSQPRRDMKQPAKALIARFGSFADAISADPLELKEVEGVGDAAVVAMKTVREAALRLSRGGVMNKHILSSWQDLMDYLRAGMAFDKTERFRILYLNRKNALIADEVQQKGTVDHTPVYPREVVKRALELGATAIIMVHNHPSGDPTPSRDDIKMTREVREAGGKLGIALHDHVIISKKDNYSFKSNGLL